MRSPLQNYSEQSPEDWYGAAMLAMVGCDEYPDLISCAGSTVKKKLAAKCDKEIHEKYNRGFEIYRSYAGMFVKRNI